MTDTPEALIQYAEKYKPMFNSEEESQIFEQIISEARNHPEGSEPVNRLREALVKKVPKVLQHSNPIPGIQSLSIPSSKSPPTIVRSIDLATPPTKRQLQTSLKKVAKEELSPSDTELHDEIQKKLEEKKSLGKNPKPKGKRSITPEPTSTPEPESPITPSPESKKAGRPKGSTKEKVITKQDLKTMFNKIKKNKDKLSEGGKRLYDVVEERLNDPAYKSADEKRGLKREMGILKDFLNRPMNEALIRAVQDNRNRPNEPEPEPAAPTAPVIPTAQVAAPVIPAAQAPRPLVRNDNLIRTTPDQDQLIPEAAQKVVKLNSKFPQLNKKEREPVIVENLVKFPSLTLIVAKKFAGKSNLVLDIVVPHLKEFDNVFVFTNTDNTGNLDPLVESEEFILNAISDEFIDELVKQHKQDDMKTLLVFDDVLPMDGMNSKKVDILNTSGRNFGISIIYSIQTISNSLRTSARKNAEYFFIGSLFTEEANTISKLLGNPSMPYKSILKELAGITRDSDEHNWLFYDTRKNLFLKILGKDLTLYIS